MWRKIRLILLLVLWVAVYMGVCDEMYVIPRKSISYDMPDVQSQKLHILTQNMLLKTYNVTEDGWVRTDYGWVRGVILSPTPVELSAQRNTQIASIEVRKRASNFASSAAAGRGLNSENVRDRNRVSFKEYDFDSIKWLEIHFTYDYPYLIEFWRKQRGEATAGSQSKEGDKEEPCAGMCLPIRENE